MQMKIVMPSSTFKKFLAGLSFLFLLSFSLTAQESDPANGKKLFNTNCAACHKLDKKLIGPPLGGVADRRSNEWLQAWIKDNNALRATGDQDAIDIFEEYNGMPMTPYPQLSEQDINDILAYTSGEPAEAKVAEVASQEVDPKVAVGKKIFQTNCASCHKLDKKLIGPALGGIADRRSAEWLRAWIKDNNALRASGDQDAIDIFEEYNGMPMTAFPQLSDEDIDAIIAYTTAGDVQQVVAAAEGEVLATPKSSTAWMSYIVVLVLLGLIIWIYVASNNGFLKIAATIFVLILTGYILFDTLMDIGIDQDYQPIQPIAFSHKIHAGDNKIDCQYCHSSAKHSKMSGIPSVNVCMNCHKSISEYNGPTTSDKDKAFYDAEIQKIYDAIGWDSENLAYIENYEQKPIKWVRIHSLPDFAYFNHAQHVTAGGVACQKCHGPVEEMEDMYQFSPLTMGWCLDCHKTTAVDLKGNDYYAKIHEELAKKYDVNKVTIAQLGGKECGKCHY
jgi:mono/diheme cytochrome c family protein